MTTQLLKIVHPPKRLGLRSFTLSVLFPEGYLDKLDAGLREQFKDTLSEEIFKGWLGSVGIATLKANWCENPCWDIEDSEGFEDYHDELLKFRQEKEFEW